MPFTVQPDPFEPQDSIAIFDGAEDGGPAGVGIPYEEIPQLITALRRAYNEHTGVNTTSFNQHLDGTEGLAALQYLLTTEPHRAALEA